MKSKRTEKFCGTENGEAAAAPATYPLQPGTEISGEISTEISSDAPGEFSDEKAALVLPGEESAEGIS